MSSFGMPLTVEANSLRMLANRPKLMCKYPWKRDKGDMRFKEDGKTEGAADYVVCIQAIVTTPDSSSVEWVQPLYSLPNSGDEKEEFEPKEPLKVLKHTRLGFG